jgi:uncharacterized protein YecE (DUF72 family)
MGQVRVGTSGWQYDSWIDPFYRGNPPSLKQYQESFDSVEINGTFYGLPDGETVASWSGKVSSDFRFSVKASRYLTHMKKLKDPQEPLERFLTAVEPLGKKLGPILFQLPPKWRRNARRLEGFLSTLPPQHRYAFEFRDPDWYHPETYELLKEANAGFCIYHLAGHQSPKEVTADFVYLRLHGSQEAYRGSYSQQDLAAWAGAISSWNRSGKDVYVYFDNDQEAAAPGDAQRLREMIGSAS